MVMLDVAQRMRHVRLAGQERHLPQSAACADDSGNPAHVAWQLAAEQLGTECRRPQFRVREPQVVRALRDVIGKFVRQTVAEAPWATGRIYDIDAGDLRLFAAVEGK